MKFFRLCVALAVFLPSTAQAAPPQAACPGNDLPCLLAMLEQDTAAIPETAWRDSTWRELAKLLARQGEQDRAVAIVQKIKTPDTQAITIRGIGMAAAQYAKLTKPQYDDLFSRLTAAANRIDHPPSQAIALNYISESQAAAGDDDGSLKTALAMKNQEMRNKALYDSSKLQAAAGRLEAVAASIDAIDQAPFRDKARRTAAKIRTDNKDYDGALRIAGQIETPYQKAQAVLYILVRQISPEEVSVQ